jgi:hypothetical protein
MDKESDVDLDESSIRISDGSGEENQDEFACVPLPIVRAVSSDPTRAFTANRYKCTNLPHSVH